MPRARRITRGDEIRLLFRRGKRSRTASLDVYAAASPAPFPRVGLVVPRHRKTAVQRNELKRRLRDILRVELLPRLEHAPGATSLDVLVRARREAYDASFQRLREELVQWLERTC